MIIGVTGLIGSGKGAVSNILVKQGFIKLGHSDVISQELVQKDLEVTRENQVAIANEMRRLYGAGYWAKKLLEKIEPGKNYVVEGFRNVAEIEEFRKMPDFYLVGVAAGFKRRFDWIMQRSRAGDPQDLEEFKRVEQRDFLEADHKHGQQNALCFSMSDHYIANEGTFEDLERDVQSMLAKIGFK